MAVRLIVGCGYVGMRVASRWLQKGDTVFAITRSSSRASELRQSGIKPIVWDWLLGGPAVLNESLLDLGEGSGALATILIAVSHAPQPKIPHAATHALGLSHLDRLLKNNEWSVMVNRQTKWVYLSTTGVFGASSPGDWVDEESDIFPERPGSIAAWAGEQWIASNIECDQRVTLRPVGIYGPDRVPRWQSVRDQIPFQIEPESYLNLIHVDDLAMTIEAVSATKMKSMLYCVSDGSPVRRKDYYEYIAAIGGWPQPVFEIPKPREIGAVSLRSDGNKRVRNHRLQSELAIGFQFPSYREGLRSLLAGLN